MAKTTAPLLSFGGSGQIGKTQVYSTWRGVKYARRYVIPANPNSESQQATRGVFRFLSAVWKVLNPSVQAPWTAFAKGRPLTNRNAFVKSNLSALRGTDMDPVTVITSLVISPGANAGLAAAGLAAVDDAAHGITATLTAPDLPAGWSITQANFIAIKQQNAGDNSFPASVYHSDNATPYTAAFVAIGAGTWVVAAFFEYVKPDGSTAYSPSLSTQIVVA